MEKTEEFIKFLFSHLGMLYNNKSLNGNFRGIKETNQ